MSGDPHTVWPAMSTGQGYQPTSNELFNAHEKWLAAERETFAAEFGRARRADKRSAEPQGGGPAA